MANIGTVRWMIFAANIKMAKAISIKGILKKNDVILIGANREAIDKAEDRSKFSDLLDKLNIDQPEWSKLTNFEDAIKFSNNAGYPICSMDQN